MSSLPKVNVNDRLARLSVQRCQNGNCRHSRLQDPKLKLMKCSGCKVFWYCSKECQAANWPEHKAICRQARKENQTIDELSKTLENNLVVSPGGTVNDYESEFRAFVDHFRPQILMAALSAFRHEPTPDEPQGWRDDVFHIKAVRQAHPPALAPRWARFDVESALRIPAAELAEIFGAEYANVRRNRAADLRKAEGRGAGHGMITIWVSGFTPLATIQAPWPYFFSPSTVNGTERVKVDPLVFLQYSIRKLVTKSLETRERRAHK